jgi:hypothetical protein
MNTNNTVLISLSLVICFTLYILYRFLKNSVASQMAKVSKIDTECFESIAIFDNYHELVDNLYHMAVNMVPKLVTEGKIKSASDKLTMYSLYK